MARKLCWKRLVVEEGREGFTFRGKSVLKKTKERGLVAAGEEEEGGVHTNQGSLARHNRNSRRCRAKHNMHFRRKGGKSLERHGILEPYKPPHMSLRMGRNPEMSKRT